MAKTIYLTYEFDEVRYAPFGITRIAYQLTYDYEVEITLEDIINFYFVGFEKDTIKGVKNTLTQMDNYDLLNWETIENDDDFIKWLKEENESNAYSKLVEELEESARESY